MKLQSTISVLTLCAAMSLGAGACSKAKPFNIRDVDPGQAGAVRSLGPESQDAIRVSDLMMRSIIESDAIANAPYPPTISMLPMVNNSRFPFNSDVFSSRLRAELNRKSGGRMSFVARDMLDDVHTEREGKRDGQLDYDPNRRTRTIAGVDYFLRGQLDGLSTASTAGMAEYSVYTFKLVDAESTLIVWEDLYEVKKEGRDDVIYR